MLCIDSPSMRGRPSYLMILHVERMSEMDLYYLHVLWILCLTGRPTYVILEGVWWFIMKNNITKGMDPIHLYPRL